MMFLHINHSVESIYLCSRVWPLRVCTKTYPQYYLPFLCLAINLKFNLFPILISGRSLFLIGSSKYRSCHCEKLCRIYTLYTQPGKRVLSHAEYAGPARQDYPKHTIYREHIYLKRSRSSSENRCYLPSTCGWPFKAGNILALNSLDHRSEVWYILSIVSAIRQCAVQPCTSIINRHSR